MKTIYLNDADGRKSPLIDRQPALSGNELAFHLKTHLAPHFHVDPTDLYFEQNFSSHLAQVIIWFRKVHPECHDIWVDSHEIRWVETMLASGQLPLDEMTYPNYAPPYQKTFPPSRVHRFDPVEFCKAPERFLSQSPQIVVMSHVSRITGQLFPIGKIHEFLQQYSCDSVLVVDAAQVVGAQYETFDQHVEAYIAVSSKFIGGEPHLGIACFSSEFQHRYMANQASPEIETSHYAKELFSALQSLQTPAFQDDYPSRIRTLKQWVEQEFSTISGIEVITAENQVPHILTLYVGTREQTREMVTQLRKRFGIIVFHNLDYSLVEPEIPCVRVSISARASKNDLECLGNALRELVDV